MIICTYSSMHFCTLNHNVHVIFFKGQSDTCPHSELQVFMNFLACFVKSEHLNLMPKTLATLVFDKLLPLREIYVGREANLFRLAHPQHPVSTYSIV